MAESTQKTTSLSNIIISYTTHNLQSPSNNNNTKPTLCFIHGWCCSSALWSAQSPLYTTHPSMLIDLPGHGSSSAPENFDYSIEFHARAIHAVLSAEKISRVVFIAHSMGGVICTTFLRLYGTEMVRGIVYVSSFWLMPVHYLSSEQRRGLGGALRDDEMMMSMFSHAWTEKSTHSIISKVRETMLKKTPLHVRLTAVTTDSLPAHWREDEVYADLPLLQITYSGAPEWDAQAERHLPGLKTERWEGVSVFLFMEEGERFNGRVEKFLGENGLA